MPKEKKPTVTVFVDCPHCQSELKIAVYKKRLGEPLPAEYDITTNVTVEKQGKLFDTGGKKKAKAAAS